MLQSTLNPFSSHIVIHNMNYIKQMVKDAFYSFISLWYQASKPERNYSLGNMVPYHSISFSLSHLKCVSKILVIVAGI